MAASQAAAAPASSVLSWYDARTPRILDLVGDYAGKELFLVEGDSLLRACFEDGRIDFEGKLCPLPRAHITPPHFVEVELL
jgi:hypothetical protein